MSTQIPSHDRHRREAPAKLGCGVISVSDSRNFETDLSGALLVSALEGAGHRVIDRRIVRDESWAIESALLDVLSCGDCDAVLLTGGTGISPRDVTIPVVEGLCERILPGFGEIFRYLSYEEIGAAAMLSRAVAGVRGRQAIVAMPGSTGAVRLAMDKLVIPELGHLLREARKAE